MKRVYIAGKVTGLPYGPTCVKFAAAAAMIEKLGFKAINPMVEVPSTITWIKAMRICIPLVKGSDAVFLLPDWDMSSGARMEKICADTNQIPVFTNIEELRLYFENKC